MTSNTEAIFINGKGFLFVNYVQLLFYNKTASFSRSFLFPLFPFLNKEQKIDASCCHSASSLTVLTSVCFVYRKSNRILEWCCKTLLFFYPFTSLLSCINFYFPILFSFNARSSKKTKETNRKRKEKLFVCKAPCCPCILLVMMSI